MSTIKGNIKKGNDTFIPITNINAVYDDNNNRLDNILEEKSDVGHTHNYAGSDTPGGMANIAKSLYGVLVENANPDTMTSTGLYVIRSLASGATLPCDTWVNLLVFNCNLALTAGAKRVVQMLYKDHDPSLSFVRLSHEQYSSGWSPWVSTYSSLPAGMVWWYSGHSADLSQTHSLLCNGQAVSRTTYSKLFTAITTKYGAGDGSTTFNVPNLITNRRFIRANTTAGATEDDQIRNITGWVSQIAANVASGNATGALRYTGGNKQDFSFRDIAGVYYHSEDIDFSANQNAGGGSNPMAGHANGSDIHPANISMIPLITY